MSRVPFLYINIIALSLFGMLFITFLASKKTREIWAFLIMMLDCVVWIGGSILMRLQIWPGLNFWYYVSLVAIFSMEVVFYNFLHSFAHERGKFLLGLFAVATAALLPGTLNGFFLAPPSPVLQADGTMVYRYDTVYWHMLFPCVLFIAIIIASLSLLKRMKKERGPHSSGVYILFFGGVVELLGNLMQIFIPGNTFPFDALAGVIYACLMAFALYRRRLFRMTLIVSRGVLILSVTAVCIFLGVYCVDPFYRFFMELIGTNGQAALTLVSLLLAGLLTLTYSGVRRLVDVLFTREEQQNKLVKGFSADISQTLSTEDIMSKTAAVLNQELAISQIYICLFENDKYVAKYSSNPLVRPSFSIDGESPKVHCLRDQEPYLIVQEYMASAQALSEWSEEKELFRRLQIDCVGAMRDGRQIVALVLLSARDHRRSFTAAETGFLETVCSIASIAMKNAGLYEKMFREARIDELTGAYNYRYFAEQEEQLFESCRGECLTLLFVDVDDMKLYNQLYGVEAGNDALQRICEEIRRCIGETGVLFRSSGKVFAVLLPREDARRAQVVAEEIVRRVHAINAVPERRNFKTLTVSIGVCSAPYAAASAKELLDNADLAAYNAKQSGKNQIVLFRSEAAAIPKQLAERTDAIVDRIELGGESYRSALSMISALTAAIDAKDHYTYAHSKNVARYAANLAVAAGLNDDQVRTIYAAGLLHDIGKISIPEDILNKSGKLTDSEYGIMKDHVNNSIEMIRHLPEMDYLIPAALGHHERWDGKGYPRGIAGEDIPVSARCLSIADVFDAMTTDRPYRKGLPLDYALSEIQKGEGTQFDPNLAAVFIQLVRGQEIVLAPHDR